MTKISVKFCQNLKRANGNVKQIVSKPLNFNLIWISYDTILYENEQNHLSAISQTKKEHHVIAPIWCSLPGDHYKGALH